MKTCPTCSVVYGNTVGFCPVDGAVLRASSGLEPGAIIRQKYQIISEIGRGGMGSVYRARHLLFHEEKALKLLTAEGAGAQQAIKEAMLVRQLRHPHIVGVDDVDFTEDNQPFVVMEYVDGQDLSKRLKGAGLLQPELALRFTAETCSALAAAHQRGIVHRDIKPQNLLLAKDAKGHETVKVIDFGIAKVREEAGLGFTGVLTGTTGFVAGTPAYVSPEQVQGISSDLDGRSDLYSVAVVLYEMLTGRLPFSADNAQALAAQRLLVDPLPLDRARPGLVFSAELTGLVMKRLERDRGRRFQTADEMQRAILALLDSWRAGQERMQREMAAAHAGAAQEDVDRGKQERGPKHGGTTTPPPEKPRSPLLAISLGALAVALVAIGFLIVDNYRGTGAPVDDPAVIERKAKSTAPGLPSKPAANAPVKAEPMVVAKVDTPRPPENRPSPPAHAVVNPKDGLTYILIPGGTYSMGCSPGDTECYDDEKPARQVTVNAFRIGQTDVTQAAFERVMPATKNPSHFKGSQLPVDSVTWNEANDYCHAIGGRLPTEKEWEYAARGGTTGARYDDLDKIAWYYGNSGGSTHEVGKKAPNSYGLYDMLGNVWQWTADSYDASTKSLRGGSWGYDPGDVRVSVRGGSGPGGRFNYIGFRCIGE